MESRLAMTQPEGTTPRLSAYPSGGGEWLRSTAEHCPASERMLGHGIFPSYGGVAGFA
jgi:hypothetical protein